MYVRKVKKATGKSLSIEGCRKLMHDSERAITKQGYDNFIDPVNVSSSTCSFRIRNIRLNDERVRKHGHNISPYSGRRGRVLGWNDWVRVNNTINRIADKHKISAKVDSLGGKFNIRDGTESFTEDDWENKAGYDNVGSMVRPVNRIDAWCNEHDMTKEEIADLKRY